MGLDRGFEMSVLDLGGGFMGGGLGKVPEAVSYYVKASLALLYPRLFVVADEES